MLLSALLCQSRISDTNSCNKKNTISTSTSNPALGNNTSEYQSIWFQLDHTTAAVSYLRLTFRTLTS